MNLFLAWAAGPRKDLGLPFIDGGWGALVKAMLPVVAYLALAPVLYVFFRTTWRELDEDAAAHRKQCAEDGKVDYRPAVMFAIVAIVLSLQEYYGTDAVYQVYLKGWLSEVQLRAVTEGGWGRYVDVAYYDRLYGLVWWAITRILGYTLVPLAIWKLVFREDSLLDMGFRTKGLLKHAWIYGLCLVVVIPAVFIVAQSAEFRTYYPFYKLGWRSGLELVVWEALYIGQFFALEVFFRGFMLVPLRKTLGGAAIFAMCVPYVMIHFGKPYLEASTAFLAGVALGSLAMKTKSIYSGFLVHVTVALLMDGLAIYYKHGFPTVFWPAH
ncbi:MAG: CPBP family intramembrane metalloprotease [Myxococcales bacterium]|nr:CPBP family intramembrane metalloprotease [Myxococcales bacterium]